MKALSLSQPWCWLTANGHMPLDNRTWMPPITMIGERFALHAAKSWDETAFRYIIEFGIEAPARRDLYVTGVFMAVATLDRVVTEAKSLPPAQARWFFGHRPNNVGWCLADVVKLGGDPIPARGAQGLWTVPAGAESCIAEQMGRAA